MNITKARAQNFLSYKNFGFTYSKLGLTLVEGNDEDLNVSTGTGKSAFLDVISYGLYGVVSKDLAADEVINRQEKKNMYVVICFEEGGNEYEIHRARKHDIYGTDAWYTKNGGQPVRGKDLRETETLIEKLVGASFEVFKNATYFSQFSSVDRFLQASDKDKKEMITEICGLSQYDEMVEKIKALSKAADVDELTLKTRLEGATGSALYISKNLEETKLKIAKWNKDHAQEIERAEAMRDQFEKNKAAEIEEKQKTVEKEIKIREELVKKIDQAKEAAVEVDFAKEKSLIAEKQKLVSVLEGKRNDLIVDINSKTREVNKIKRTIEEELKKTSITDCPFCHASISKDLIQKHVLNIGKEAESLIVDIERVKLDVAQIDQGIAIKASLEEKMRSLITEEARVTASLKVIDSLRDQRDKADAYIEFIKKGIEATKDKMNPYLSQVDELKAKTNPHTDSVDKFSKELKEVQIKIDETELALKTVRQELKNLAWWKEAINVYIKSFLMDSFIDHINTKANEYLNLLFDGVLQVSISAVTDKGKTVKEKISVDIINGEEKCSFESLSGGERCRVGLSINLAVSDLSAKMSSKSFNILMLDEIFEGLDEKGKNQTMKLLKSLEDRFDTIFVIDHTEAFKNMFSNSVMIKKKNKVSSVIPISV